MSRRSNQSAVSAAIYTHVMSLLTRGVDTDVIYSTIATDYNLARRSIARYLGRARDAMTQLGQETATEARNTWRARIEQQYRDTYQIEDIDKRLRRQEAIAALGIKLSGADTLPPRSVNVFNFYPGQHAASIHTDYIVESEDSPALGAAPDAPQSTESDGDRCDNGSDRPVWAMPQSHDSARGQA